MTSADPIGASASPNGVIREPFERVGMGWLWREQSHDVELCVDYITVTRDEIHGEIAVTRAGRHLHLARFNLSSTTSRKTLVKELDSIAGEQKGLAIPWGNLVEQFCVAVLRRERMGGETRYTAEAPARPLRYLVDELVMLDKTNMLYAPGGAGKGYLCVGICCATAVGATLADLTVREARPYYFDWEDDFETFQQRVNAVARGFRVRVPRIPYREMRGLLANQINEIARTLSDNGCNLGIIDSFSAAGGTTSEHTSWDSIAHRMFDALKLIPDMTWLIVDHVAGNGNSKDPTGKAFGSIQKMNRVRNAWEMRSEQEAGSRTVHMKLFDGKWNHTGKRKPMGMRLEFDAGAVQFHSEDVLETATPAGPANVATRMGIQLAVGPMSVNGLAKACRCTPATIRGEMHRDPERFARNADGLVCLASMGGAPEPLPW